MSKGYAKIFGMRLLAMILAMSLATSSVTVMAEASPATAQMGQTVQIAQQAAALEKSTVPKPAKASRAAGTANPGAKLKALALGMSGVQNDPSGLPELVLDLHDTLKDIQPGDRLLVNPDGMVTIDEQHRAEARLSRVLDSRDAKEQEQGDKAVSNAVKPAYLDSAVERTSAQANPELQGLFSDAELENCRIYLETKLLEGDELDRTMSAADAWSAEVTAWILDSNYGAAYMAQLEQNTPCDKFTVTSMPAKSSGFNLFAAVEETRVLSAVVDNLSNDVRDSNGGSGAGKSEKDERDAEEEREKQENEEKVFAELYRSDVVDSSRISDPGTDVFIVDDDAVILQVKDQNNVPVNGAAVYIKIGNREDRKVTQKLNNVDGCVVFTGMTGLNSGYLDISKDGFRVITQLDTDLHGGSKLDRKLIPVGPREIYARVMDIGGADMVNSTPELFLTQYAVSKYDIVFVLSGGSPAAFNNSTPGAVKLEAKDAQSNTRTVMTANPTDIGNRMHWKYAFNNRWAELKSGENKLFLAGDQVAFAYGADRYPAKLSVRNAAFEKPWYLPDLEFGFSGGYGKLKLPDWVPMIGGTPLELEIAKFPVLLIVNVSGTGMVGVNVRADKAITQKSYEQQFDNPRYINKVDGIFNKIKEYAKSRMNQIKAAGKFVGSFNPPATKYVTRDFGISVQTILYAQCKYNWDTGYIHSGVSALIGVVGQATGTTYYVVPPPVYLGLTGKIGASVGGEMGVRFKPGERFKETLEIDTKSGITGLSIGALLGFTLFTGVGMRGVLCLEAGGGLTLTGLADFQLREDLRPPDKTYPRFTLDLSFNYYIKAFLAFFSIGKSGEKTIPMIVDTWNLKKGEESGDEEAPQTEVYKVVFDGMAEGEGSSYDPETGIISPGTLYDQPAADYGPVNGGDGKDGYGFTAISGVGTGANSPIRYIRIDDDMYVFRLAVVKDYYLGIPYEHPVLVYQKQNPDGKTFENKYYQIPVPRDRNYSGYDYAYEFDAKDLSGNTVQMAMVNGYRGAFYNMEDCMNNTIARYATLLISKNKIIGDAVFTMPGKGYIHSPVVTPHDNGESAFAWIGTANPLSTKPNTRKNYLLSYHTPSRGAGAKSGTVDLGYEKTTPPRIFTGPILPLSSGSGQPSDKDGDIYIANSWYENQEYEISTFNSKQPQKTLNKTNVKVKNPSTIRVYENDPLAGGQNFMMYVDNGALKLFAGDKSKLSTDQIVTLDGKPFMLPKNSDIYAYASGTLNGRAVMKLVTIHKDFPDVDGSERSDSVISIYDIQRVSAAKIVARGPRQYRLEGVDVIHSEIVFDDWSNNKGLHMLYTANNKTNMVKEFNADGQGATGEITTVCNVYRWDEPNISSASATTFTMENPVISKKDKKLKAYIEVENDGTMPISSVTIEVKDNSNSIVSTYERALDLFPGEKLMFDWTFDQPTNWQVGPQRLTARVKQAKTLGWDGVAQTVQIEDNGALAVTQNYNQCYLEMNGSDAVYDSNHFAALSIRNRSMMPTSDNTELRVYRIKNSSDVDGAVYAAYDLGVLKEGLMKDGDFKDHSYNMMIPLDEYWADENCRGVLISVVCKSDDHVEASIELSNPNTALRFPVNVDASDVACGTVEGGGYLLPGRSATLKAESKRGYRFAGWADETGRIVSTDPVYTMDVPSETVNLTAQFEETGEVHKVALEIGNVAETLADGTIQQIRGGIPIVTGGELNGTFAESYAVDHGTTIELSANPVGDYAFVHWEDETGKVLSTREEFSIPVTQKMYIKAVYAQGIRRFNLALEAGVGGECETGSIWTNTKGEMDIPLPDAFKSGSQFLGWFTQETGGTRVTESHVFTDDTILYAQYSGSSGGGGGSGGGSSGGNKLLPPKRDKNAASSSSASSKPQPNVSSSLPASAPANPPQTSGTASSDDAASSDGSSETDQLISSSEAQKSVISSSAVEQPSDPQMAKPDEGTPRQGGIPVVPIAVGVVAILVLGGGGFALAASGLGAKWWLLLKNLFRR